jgi:hypothetical protein
VRALTPRHDALLSLMRDADAQCRYDALIASIDADAQPGLARGGYGAQGFAW